jgi:hypothetical protein
MNILSMKKTMLYTTKIASALMMTGLLTTTVFAASQKAAPDAGAAPTQVDIQTVMIQRCTGELTAAKITDAKNAQKFCGCTIGIQANNLKVGEFWAMQSAAMSGKDPRSLPAVKRIQPQLEKCRDGVSFNAPSTDPGAAPAAGAPTKP